MMRLLRPLDGDPTIRDELRELLVAAIDNLPTGRCDHARAIVSVCVRCRDQLRCTACQEAHFDDHHGMAWRYTCDRCGGRDRDLMQIASAVLLDIDGQPTIVCPDGLGLCSPCAHLATVGAGGVG